MFRNGTDAVISLGHGERQHHGACQTGGESGQVCMDQDSNRGCFGGCQIWPCEHLFRSHERWRQYAHGFCDGGLEDRVRDEAWAAGKRNDCLCRKVRNTAIALEKTIQEGRNERLFDEKGTLASRHDRDLRMISRPS